MGLVAIEGSAQMAPLYVPEAGEVPAWCKKDVVQLSAADVAEIGRFCHQTGWEAGWDAITEGRIPSELDNPFHQDFLCGSPHELWRLAYWRGVREANASEDYRHLVRAA